MDAFWIILTGSLVAISCGILGVFLVLRKMAMVGDAISHAVLPGIVLAYLVSESRESLPMLIGAAVLGIITTLLIELLHKRARLQTDASIGITFTWLFALGIILISLFAGQVDLDQDCVLHGEIAYITFDLLDTGTFLDVVPRPVFILTGTLLVIIAFLYIGYKGLFITTFDVEYAAAIGISVGFWHYSLMGLVSLTTVTSFESVGAILVVALLVVPPATAYLLTENLKKMIVYTAIIGVLCAIGGYYLAVLIDGSIAGAMTVIAGILFTLVFLLAPGTGFISKRLRNSRESATQFSKSNPEA